VRAAEDDLRRAAFSEPRDEKLAVTEEGAERPRTCARTPTVENRLTGELGAAGDAATDRAVPDANDVADIDQDFFRPGSMPGRLAVSRPPDRITDGDDEHEGDEELASHRGSANGSAAETG
jgi:hypothetical protein